MTTGSGTTTVIVESRDLDTDAREREAFEVPPPAGPDQQRMQLMRLVATTHPSAKPRTFADGAATFLDRQHLVVAFYVDRGVATRRRARGRLTESQEPLFEA